MPRPKPRLQLSDEGPPVQVIPVLDSGAIARRLRGRRKLISKPLVTVDLLVRSLASFPAPGPPDDRGRTATGLSDRASCSHRSGIRARKRGRQCSSFLEFETTQGDRNRMSVRRLGDRAAGGNAGFSLKANRTARKKPQSLLTVAEAAEILNMSEKTVRRFIERRLLRASKIGGLVRIVPADLEDLIRDHRSH